MSETKVSPQHSPLPWRSKENTRTIFCDVNATSIGYVNHPNADERRQLIVRAVNSHEVAVEMAGDILRFNYANDECPVCGNNNDCHRLIPRCGLGKMLDDARKFQEIAREQD